MDDPTPVVVICRFVFEPQTTDRNDVPFPPSPRQLFPLDLKAHFHVWQCSSPPHAGYLYLPPSPTPFALTLLCCYCPAISYCLPSCNLLYYCDLITFPYLQPPYLPQTVQISLLYYVPGLAPIGAYPDRPATFLAQ